MIHTFCTEYDNVRIRQINENDIESMRNWRNNKDNGKYLRPIDTITKEMQEKWFQEYLQDDSIIMFAIEETKDLKRLVGSVAIYDFNGIESNCGKTMIGDPEAGGRNLGYRGEVLALHVGYQKRGIKYYITEINQENIKSQKMAAKLGFIKVGERPLQYGSGYEDCFRMTYEEFYEKHPELINVPVKGE